MAAVNFINCTIVLGLPPMVAAVAGDNTSEKVAHSILVFFLKELYVSNADNKGAGKLVSRVGNGVASLSHSGTSSSLEPWQL